MNKAAIVVCVCALGLFSMDAAPGPGTPAPGLARPAQAGPVPVPDFGRVPLSFIPNGGQVDAEAVFYARASRYTLWMTEGGLVFDASRTVGTENPRPGEPRGRRDGGRRERDVTTLAFPGADPSPAIEAVDVAGSKVSVLRGSDPARWTTGLAASNAVLYKDLFPGIDLKVYGVEREVEYDWIVNPGADVADIRFEYRDVLGTTIDPVGSLRVRTRFGDLVHRAPAAYQIVDGEKVRVEARFLALGGDRYGFAAGAFNASRPLVIDPVILVSSTYLGGKNFDSLHAMALDAEGNVYITGDTQSPDFPTKNAIDDSLSGVGYDMVVAKMAASGKSLVYSTYLGGSDWDSGSSIAVDATGAAYVAGWTKSKNFPVVKAFDSSFNGNYDGVFLKLNPAGDALVFSSFLGPQNPNGYEGCNAILLDKQGNIYLTGDTDQAGFPVKAGYDMTYNGGGDVFISKFAPSGRSLIYSTYFGGGGQDYPTGLAVDAQGAVVITGFTTSRDFPKKNSYKKTIDGFNDAFVAKLNPAGTALVYSTVFGGSERDRPSDVQIDGKGYAYVTGVTESSDFPVLNAFDSTYAGGEGDAFLTKIAPTGKPFVFSTFLGGAGEDEGESVAVDATGSIYVLSTTASAGMPVKGAYDQTLGGESDAHLAKFAPSGRSLVFATFLGGSDEDWGSQVRLDGRGWIAIIGGTKSRDFPVRSAFDKTLNGDYDGFVVRMGEVSSSVGATRPKKR
jgi:hypothetical protein